MNTPQGLISNCGRRGEEEKKKKKKIKKDDDSETLRWPICRFR